MKVDSLSYLAPKLVWFLDKIWSAEILEIVLNYKGCRFTFKHRLCKFETGGGLKLSIDCIVLSQVAI